MFVDAPRDGDKALLLFPNGEDRIITLKAGKVTQTKYGAIRHDDMLTKSWGGIIETSTGFRVFFQKPTYSEIVYSLFSRKSQVIYEKDVALMLMHSGIGKGSIVGESGVGSGFLTAHILSAIGSKDSYWGYEIREDMAETAVRNLNLLGYDIRDRIIIKDIREGVEERGFQAFFLDLPEPWEAMESIYDSLAASARVVAFVPSTNQIIKTLNYNSVKKKYYIYRVFETMVREYEKDGEAFRPSFFQKVFSGYVMVFLKKSQGD
jgi:tRNA (adenine57-N1/adenine58-N1)-methyltransferase